MGKSRVVQWGKPQGFVTVDPAATVGATFGVDLRWPNGDLVKLSDFQSEDETSGESGAEFSYWIQIVDVPPLVQSLTALAGTGVVRKTDATTLDVAATTTDLPEGVNLYYTDARSDARATAAVDAHEAQSDPHPQYTTTAEAAAAAPVQSVAGRTGAVTLTTVDVSGLGTAATHNVPASGDAAAGEVVLGNDSRLGGSSAFVPRFVGVGGVFSVPDNTQALFALPIMVDGDLMVSGDLVGVA